MKFNFQRQKNEMDCGPTCIYMIAKFYGKTIDLNIISNFSNLGKEGTNLFGLSETAEKFGFRTLSVKVGIDKLISDVPLPCIVHWNQNHFVVVTPNSTKKKIEVADPEHGILLYTRAEFCEYWLQTTEDNPGIALLLEPTPEFYQQQYKRSEGVSWEFLFRYLQQYKQFFFQLVLGLFIASGLQLVFPFLTQSIVDVGINSRNLQYIYIILIAQLFLFTGRTITEFIRSHLLMHLGTRINISILSDFWIKLMQLPLSYFDVRKTGDTLQRIGDHSRIQQFLTTGSLNVLFSLINLNNI
jgi:ATP-binding cassette subfamily B protein